MAEINNICDLAWKKLALGIVAQAVVDYKKALDDLKQYPQDTTALRTRRDTLKFFQSDWYQILCDYDPERLIKKVQSCTGRLTTKGVSPSHTPIF